MQGVPDESTALSKDFVTDSVLTHPTHTYIFEKIIEPLHLREVSADA